MIEKIKSIFYKKPTLVISGIVILFLISFTSASWIYIKSNDLIFKDTVKDYEEKFERVDEAEKRIAELEAQLERYKSLYDGAVKDSRVLSTSVQVASENTDKTEEVTEEEEAAEETIVEEATVETEETTEEVKEIASEDE